MTGLGVYLVSLLFVQFPIHNIWVVLYFSFFVSLAFSSVGILVALFSEEFEHISMWTTFVVEPLIFFGGVFHSVKMLPHTLQVVTSFNPIFYMVNGMRYGMLGASDVSIGHCLVVVFCFFACLFSFTVFLFKTGFKLRK